MVQNSSAKSTNKSSSAAIGGYAACTPGKGTSAGISRQDTAVHDGDQKSVGASVDIDLVSGTGASVSLNGGKTDIDANYASVTEQSGYQMNSTDLKVGGKAIMEGAYFLTETEDDNQAIFAGGVEIRDINNINAYDASSISGGVTIGKNNKVKNPNGKDTANVNGIGYGKDSDSSSSVTIGAITGQGDNPTVTLTDLDSLNKPLENTFDVVDVTEQIGAQVEITKAFDQERRKIKTKLNNEEQKLRDEAEQALAHKDYEEGRVKTLAADKIQERSLIFDGITSALYGPNSNGAVGYVVKAISPQVAFQIGEVYKRNEARNSLDNEDRPEVGSAEHLFAHALLGAAVSYATGNDVVTGGLGASAGEGTAILLSKYIYRVEDPSDLTPEQKDTISNIVNSAGLALGATTGKVTDAVNTGETGLVAVQDNFDEVGHYYMTYIAALEGGFSDEQAKKLAKAAWAPDTDNRNAMSAKSLAQSFFIQPFDVVRPEGRDNRASRNQPSIHALGIADDIMLTNTQEKRDRLEDVRTSVANQVSSLFNLIVDNKNYQFTTADEDLLHIYGNLYAHDLNGLPFREGFGHFYPGENQDNPGYKYSKENFKTYAEQLRRFSSIANKGQGGAPSQQYKELLNKISQTTDQEKQIKLLEDYAKNIQGIKFIDKPKPGHPTGR